MDDKEYLKNLLDRFNANNNDESFTKAEKVFLTKILDIQKQATILMTNKTELEKQMNDAKKTIAKLEADINRETIRSDAYVEALCALR